MLPVYQNFEDLFSIFSTRGLTFPAHLHAHMELCFVERGSVSMTVGSRTEQLAAGDLGIAFPHRMHGYSGGGDGAAGESILAICPVSACPDFAHFLHKQYPENPFLRSSELHPDIPFAFRSMLAAVRAEEPIDVVKAYLHLILARTLPKLALTANRARSAQDDTERIIAYTGAHFTEPLTLASLGAALQVSPFRVSRIFSEKLNTSFPTYLNALRIQHAQMLLQGTPQDVLSIAYACGYETPRTFNREFKALCGCTPREYRKKPILATQKGLSL